MPLYRVSDLQAVEPDALPEREGIIVEVDPEPDSMGFPRVDVVGRTRDEVIAYVHWHWSGDDDPDWFREYVVDRVMEAPMAYDDYVAAGGLQPKCPSCGRTIKPTTDPDPLAASRWCSRCGGTAEVTS